MDKNWIDLSDRTSKAYLDGVKSFFSFAFANKDKDKEIYCPCNKCVNRFCYTLPIVRMHLERKGFYNGYKVWTYHGENTMGGLQGTTNSNMDDATTGSNYNAIAEMIAMVHEGKGVPIIEDAMENDSPTFEDETETFSSEKAFYKRLQEAEMPMYENCPESVTELSFIVGLLHIKQLNGWSNYSFTMLLKFLKKIFPQAKIPKSYYRANKLTTDLGFKYETWDACLNGCMLFRNEDKNLDKCDICNEPRHRDVSSEGEQGKRVAARQVRYFPLKPRLQKLFWSKHTAPLMTWHCKERVDDGVMRHPADSLAWKLFDEKFPSFANDGRHVRLAMAGDGINPHGNKSTTHSTWPIVLIPYNLPPWICMKQSNIILSTLIDGPKAPGNNIDVFLQPMIEELKDLWNEGVTTLDSSNNEVFKLRAALLWTINDYPTLGDISGWVTKGKFACPTCNIDPQATWLQEGRKFCYWGHRRYLEPENKWRSHKASFDGKVDMRPPPAKLSGSQVLQQVDEFGIETVYKKGDVLRKRKREQMEKNVAKEMHQKVVRKHNHKKKSIFFELPYWEYNAIRHNLDVMHIEKNVCDNVLYTLLGTRFKTKDNSKARKDLKRMDIRHDLHLQPRGGNLEYMPPADFSLSNKDKKTFLKVLRDVRVPDGYCSNLSRCVNLEKLTFQGLKSHDNHILMQKLLPIAVRNLLPAHVVKALIELSNCFAIVCSGVNTLADLEKFQDRVALMLCSLERIFPPGFFDVMEHLPIHLADELLLGGSVFYRWMYPIERYLKTLKGFVRNHARPEASIAKSVLVEEYMTFGSNSIDSTTFMPRSSTTSDPSCSRSTSFTSSKLQAVTTATSGTGTSDPSFEEEDYDVEEDDDLAESEFSDTLESGVRGPCRPWKEWGKGRIMLDWNEKGAPVGANAAKFNNHVASYARNSTWFPLDYVRWDAIDKTTICKQIWAEIQANTNAPDLFEDLLDARIGKAWKGVKYRLKKNHYDTYETDEERLKNRPPEVPNDQWVNLVKYWGLSCFKLLSQQNKKNREKLVAYNKTGRTTHDSIREERRRGGLPTDDLTMYLLTRGRNGDYDVADGTAGKVAALQKRLEELPEEDRLDPNIRNSIFEDVIGEDGHGRVHLEGVGIRPAPKRAKHVETISNNSAQQEILELKAIIKENDRIRQEENAVNKVEIDNLKVQLKMVIGLLQNAVDPSLLGYTVSCPGASTNGALQDREP